MRLAHHAGSRNRAPPGTASRGRLVQTILQGIFRAHNPSDAGAPWSELFRRKRADSVPAGDTSHLGRDGRSESGPPCGVTAMKLALYRQEGRYSQSGLLNFSGASASIKSRARSRLSHGIGSAHLPADLHLASGGEQLVQTRASLSVWIF